MNTILAVIWHVLLLAGLVYWLIQLLAALRVTRSVPLLRGIPECGLDAWPRVSVIMPACNEEKKMEGALETRLQDDYPNVEYIIADDRSTDRTGQIADAFARQDPRVRVLHLRDLPDGWLGKLHAMDRAVNVANGAWLLFSDIDVMVKPGTLRKAVAYAERNCVDHVAIMPEIYPARFIIDILNTVFCRFISLAGRLWKVPDPRSTAAVGSGSFNLVRRSALDRAQGLERIRLEHGDDVALGRILKASGSRQAVMNGLGHVGVRMYESLSEAMTAVERPTYTALGNSSVVRLFVAGLMILWLELSPYLAFVPVSVPYNIYAGVVMVAISMATSLLVNRWFGRQIWPVFFNALGAVLVAVMIWRSGLLGAMRGGVYWRGTFYPTR